MAKEQPITIDGVIKETLPSACLGLKLKLVVNPMKFWLM